MRTGCWPKCRPGCEDRAAQGASAARAWPWSWWATTRPARSTCAARSPPAPGPASAPWSTGSRAATAQEDLEALIAGLNADPGVDGILVQLPLPRGLDSKRALQGHRSRPRTWTASTRVNQGLLLGGRRGLRPCTPSACMSMLKAYGIALKGKRAVVLGRSEIVGKPIALMLLEEHATVTIAHSRTQDLAGVCREADLLVAAVGRPGLVEGSWIKPGAVVVDVGINRVEDLALGERIFQADPGKLETLRAKGGVLCGDVRFGEAAAVAGAITPVPGRRGPAHHRRAHGQHPAGLPGPGGAPMTYARRETFLPFTRPMLGAEEIAEMVDSIESGWITTGPKAARFEEALADYNGVAHCLAMNSATTAQEITMQVLGLRPGDEVITTALTWVSTLSTVVLQGGVPVLVDIDPATLNLDPARIEAAITPRTKGIIPVHLTGLPAPMDADLADRRGARPLGGGGRRPGHGRPLPRPQDRRATRARCSPSTASTPTRT